MLRKIAAYMVVLLAGLPACGGGGGGGSSLSPYTGLTSPAVINASNADNIARQAFQGGDLGASTALAPSRPGGTPGEAGKPMALTLVRLLSGAAGAVFPGAADVRAPQPRSTETGTISDGEGIGRADYTINVNDQTGQFTGTFAFTNFHGDGGGVIVGPVTVSGVVSRYSVQILFNFQSVHVSDPVGGEDVTAFGTVNLAIDPGSGNVIGGVTLDMIFVDNVTRKSLWLSNVTLSETIGTGFIDATLSGRIYLHEYGYVDMATLVPFRYLTGDSYPSDGRFVVTGKDNHKVQLTVVDPTRYQLDVDTDGDNLWDVTAVVMYW